MLFENCQVTPFFVGSLRTVAVNVTDVFSTTVCGVAGETVTEIGGGGAEPPQPELLTATTRAIRIAISEALLFDFMPTSTKPRPKSRACLAARFLRTEAPWASTARVSLLPHRCISG
jgi:hypothetical protein